MGIDIVQTFLHRQRRVRGALGVILIRSRSAKNCQQFHPFFGNVQFVDYPAVARNRGLHGNHVALEQLRRLRRRKRLRQQLKSNDLRKQRSHRAQIGFNLRLIRNGNDTAQKCRRQVGTHAVEIGQEIGERLTGFHRACLETSGARWGDRIDHRVQTKES
jgi:hypothetical protein